MTARRNTGIPEQTVQTTPTARGTNGTILATRPLMGWRGIDLITAAMLAVAFGVMFWGFDTFIYPILSTATAGFPPAGELMLGVWLSPSGRRRARHPSTGRRPVHRAGGSQRRALPG